MYRSVILTAIVAFNAIVQTASKKEVFEMFVNGELVFSRIQMGRYPTTNVVVDRRVDGIGNPSRNWM